MSNVSENEEQRNNYNGVEKKQQRIIDIYLEAIELRNKELNSLKKEEEDVDENGHNNNNNNIIIAIQEEDYTNNEKDRTK